MKPLTPKRQRFVEEYLVDLNAAQAAIRAGYSKKTARSIGHELLTFPDVAAAIQAARARLSEDSGLTAELVDRKLARMVRADIRLAYDAKGRLRLPHEMTDDAASIVTGIEVVEEFDGHGEDRKQIGFTKKVKLADPVAILTLAARRLGMFEKENEQIGQAAAAFAAVRDQVKGGRLPVVETPATDHS